jgi:glycosyltransferase involved in cell wall biosynthesis
MKVSIITVTYNSQDTLQCTIDSVKNQSYKNIEYIIIDGNSNDNTVDIIKSNSDVVSYWISELDFGLYDAINKGIRVATGNIIGIINSDDYYKDEHVISTIVDTFIKFNTDSVFSDGRYISRKNLSKTIRYYSSRIFRPSIFRWGFMPLHTSFFVKKNHYDSFGLYKTDYKIAADFELLLRFLLIYRISYKYIPKDLIVMRMGGVSTKSWKSNLLLNREIVKACSQNGIYTNIFMLFFKYFIKIFEFTTFK